MHMETLGSTEGADCIKSGHTAIVGPVAMHPYIHTLPNGILHSANVWALLMRTESPGL